MYLQERNFVICSGAVQNHKTAMTEKVKDKLTL